MAAALPERPAAVRLSPGLGWAASATGDAADGRVRVAGDVRIDNREECLAGLGQEGRSELSDIDIFARCWERSGEASLPGILGDFAVAVWDGAALTLVRSVPTSKMLVYSEASEGLYFASAPSAIRAVAGGEPDFDYLARVIAGEVEDSSRTSYRGMRRVPPGHAVRIMPGAVQVAAWWKPPSPSSASRSIAEAADELDAQLRRAVAAVARRGSGRLGTQLSAGRDSSAVAAFAAEHALDLGETLHAYTAVPDPAFANQGVAGRMADESAVAATTAALHPTIRHHIVRAPAPFDFAFLDEVHRLQQFPLSQMSNLPWWNAVLSAAAREGISVLLTGQVGNTTISAGGATYLPDVWRESGPLAWARRAAGLGGISPGAWRSLLHQAVGPRLPRSLYRGLMGTLRPRPPSVVHSLLNAPYREMVGKAADVRDWSAGAQEARRANLFHQDNYDALPLAKWGVELRDPTADRRLVEYCLSIPSRLLVGGKDERPVYDRMVAGRVAHDVIRPPARGYQAADWPLLFPAASVAAAFDRYARHPAVGELFDVDRVKSEIDAWPRGGWTDFEVVDRYRLRLLTAVSAASFVATTF